MSVCSWDDQSAHPGMASAAPQAASALSPSAEVIRGPATLHLGPQDDHDVHPASGVGPHYEACNRYAKVRDGNDVAEVRF